MGKKILPFEEKPVITAYPHYSFMCSMIQTKPNGLEWIFQTYTQLVGYYYESPQYCDAKVAFYPWAGQSDGDLWNICPFIDKMVIPREYILNTDNHTNFVKKWIDRGWYLSMYIDEFFRDDIQEVGVYYHPLMIFGYDDDEQVLYCADCFENWVYGVKKVSYSDFEIASKQNYPTDNSMYAIQLYTLKDHDIIDYSLSFLRKQLFEYINRKCDDYYLKTQFIDGAWSYGEGNGVGYVCYGLDVFGLMKKVLEDVRDGVRDWNIKFISTPDFRLIRDHADLMQKRYEFLIEKYHMTPNEELLELMKNQVTTAMIMENQLLKYVLSKRDKILDKLINSLQTFEETEKLIAETMWREIGGIDE